MNKLPLYERFSRNEYLENTHGINESDYEIMLEQQNHCCAICGKHVDEFGRRLSVDHDHDTGRIRALLCVKCNALIGMADEDVKVLKEAIKYIKYHEKFKKHKVCCFCKREFPIQEMHTVNFEYYETSYICDECEKTRCLFPND